MKYSNVGGQAVIEGVMMRNSDRYAVAVRRPDGEIEIKKDTYEGIIKSPVLKKTPFLRGIFAFIDSLVLGMSTLSYAASFYELDEEDLAQKEQMSDEEKVRNDRKEKIQMTILMIVSLILAVGIFTMLPYFLAALFRKLTDSAFLIALMEGVLRLAIFVGYLLAISCMQDIRRVFMYHGAEHKCINCIEHGMELTVENVRKSSREHKRCGTSFLLYVVILSIIIFFFIRVESPVQRILIRLLLVPVIAGASYEIIRIAGRGDNALVRAISRPGMWLQNLTTREPDDDMIEVGIAAVESVFNWRKFLEDNFHDDPNAQRNQDASKV